MKPSYTKACIVGLVLGLLTILAAAEIPIFGESWTIPSWDHWTANISSEAAPLQSMAVLLRACKLLLESGFWFVAIPIAGACGIVRLSEMRDKPDLVWSFEAFVRTVVVLSAIAYAFGFIMSGSYVWAGHDDLAGLMLHSHAAGYVIALSLWWFPIIPSLGLIVFFAIWGRLTFDRFWKNSKGKVGHKKAKRCS